MEREELLQQPFVDRFRILRTLSNKIAGRRKILKENLDIQDAISLVRVIDSKRLKNIKFSLSFYTLGLCTYKKPTPQKVADFLDDIIKNHYNPLEKCAFATHKVYTDRFRKEKHYLDIALFRKDEIFTEFGGSVKYILSLK